MDMNDFYYFFLDASKSDVQVRKGEYSDSVFPVKYKQEFGFRFNDIINTGYPSLYLISQKMNDVLVENQLNGWCTFPVELYDSNKNEISGYFGFSIIGKSGPTSYKKSVIIEKQLVPNGSICKYFKGVDIENWDGSDFFTPEGTYQIFITRRAKEIMKRNKITKFYVENLAESEIDVRHVKKSERLDF